MLTVSTPWIALSVLVKLDLQVTVLTVQLFQSRMNVKMAIIHVMQLAVHVLIHNTAMNASVTLDTGILTQQILDALAMVVVVLFSFAIVHDMQIGQTCFMENYGVRVPSILTMNTTTDTFTTVIRTIEVYFIFTIFRGQFIIS